MHFETLLFSVFLHNNALFEITSAEKANRINTSFSGYATLALVATPERGF